MKSLLFIFSVLIGFLIPAASQADLLERIKLEDTIQTRIQDVMRSYDARAKVLIRFDYKSFQGVLPGTSLESSNGLLPTRVESSDISRVEIEIYTEIEQVPQEAKDFVLRAIPVEKSRVQVNYKLLKTQFPKDLPRPLDSQSFSDTMKEVVTQWSSMFGAGLGFCFLVLLGFLFYQNQLRMKEFKVQVGQLVSTLSELSLGGSGPSPSFQQSAQPATAVASNSSEENPLQKLTTASLKELMGDCYWCHEDEYAMWVWKKLSSDQRRELLNHVPFMKDYSLYLMDLNPREAAFHDHPTYLDPTDWADVSEENLAELVRANGSTWHFLSPMRQKHLPLTFEEKLRALQSEPAKAKPAKPTTKSIPRSLESKPSWGDLSIEDETIVYQQPDMVPETLRPFVKSLLWLAQKDQSIVEKTLAKFDARSLASAWVGPQEVLAKLETCLPEKKRKLLLTYTTKVPASRQSPAYQALVEEGFKNEAA